MTIRVATESDLAVLHELYREFLAEVPPPEYDAVDVDEELAEVTEMVHGEALALVAEDDDGLGGFALARLRTGRIGFVTDI